MSIEITQTLNYAWKSDALRDELSFDELVGIWKNHCGGCYVELRRDGTARQRWTSRGAGDFEGLIEWHYLDSRSFKMWYRTDLDPNGHGVIHRLVRFDGAMAEFDPLHVGGIFPKEGVALGLKQWWQVAKPPKSWGR